MIGLSLRKINPILLLFIKSYNMNRHKFLLFFFSVFLINCNQRGQNMESNMIDLFIWAGQSNAQGWKGNAEFYPSDSNNLDSQILLNYTFIGVSSSDGWITMQPQLGLFPLGHFGPEVTFSRKLKESGYNPAIFKFCKGGSSLYGDWKRLGESGYTDSMFDALSVSINDLSLQGYKVNIKGLIWIQGESDANSFTNAIEYENNLLNFINDFRNHFEQTSPIPIILGIDEQHPSVIQYPQVLIAHQNIAENDDFIKFTSMYGFPKADATHLTPDGLISHGDYLYESFMLLVESN